MCGVYVFCETFSISLYFEKICVIRKKVFRLFLGEIIEFDAEIFNVGNLFKNCKLLFDLTLRGSFCHFARIPPALFLSNTKNCRNTKGGGGLHPNRKAAPFHTKEAAQLAAVARGTGAIECLPGRPIILPEPQEASVPSWFGFLITCTQSGLRDKLVRCLEEAGV